MKYSRFFFALIFSFALTSSVLAQKEASVSTLPDFSGWDKQKPELVFAVLNGKNVRLVSELYIDMKGVKNLKMRKISVLHDKAKKPWLAVYLEETSEAQFNLATLTKINIYLFENVNGKWAFVMNFSASHNNPDIYDAYQKAYSFIKNRYKLEL